jgi:hypothetical protein
VKLQPSIIIVLQEVRSKEQGQHLINQEKNTFIAYFTATIQIINEKSRKKQKKMVGSIV